MFVTYNNQIWKVLRDNGATLTAQPVHGGPVAVIPARLSRLARARPRLMRDVLHPLPPPRRRF